MFLITKFSLAQLHAIYCVYRDIDFAHNVRCCTCGKSMHIEQVEDCFNLYGHYLSRSQYPHLKYHKDNAFPQCPNCNMSVSSSIDNKYAEFINYRYGEGFTEKLKQDNSFSDKNKALQFYVVELLELSQRHPELYSALVDANTGEVIEIQNVVENPIQEQWETYSPTFRQDLDEITRLLGTENIEYERL